MKYLIMDNFEETLEDIEAMKKKYHLEDPFEEPCEIDYDAISKNDL